MGWARVWNNQRFHWNEEVNSVGIAYLKMTLDKSIQEKEEQSNSERISIEAQFFKVYIDSAENCNFRISFLN